MPDRVPCAVDINRRWTGISPMASANGFRPTLLSPEFPMITPEFYAPLARFFSSFVLHEIAFRGRCGYVDYILERSGYGRRLPPGATLGEIFEDLYRFLRRRYRCEYIYKNALANKLLLGRHSLKTSALLTEFDAGHSKADLVIINGTSHVYEVKTELDSMERLRGQLDSYRKVFDRVVVVTHESQLARVRRHVNEDTGLLLLSDRYTLHRIREATPNVQNVDPATIFECLRKDEYRRVVLREFGQLPEVPEDRMRAECRKQFISLPPETAHSRMVEELKGRSPGSSAAPFIDSIPHSLRLLCLARSLTARQRATILSAVTTNYEVN